jgi:hypothetical protein
MDKRTSSLLAARFLHISNVATICACVAHEIVGPRSEKWKRDFKAAGHVQLPQKKKTEQQDGRAKRAMGQGKGVPSRATSRQTEPTRCSMRAFLLNMSERRCAQRSVAFSLAACFTSG